jgi:hypothetical protein
VRLHEIPRYLDACSGIYRQLAGRLDAEEFKQRLASAHVAKTQPTSM